MTVTIYHNPRCSKSRQTLALLKERGIKPVIKEYLNDVPNKEELNNILAMLSMSPRDLMRKNESLYMQKLAGVITESEYKENGLDNPSLSEDDLIQAMINAPKLIERPIVISKGKASIGRPPERVLDIL